MDPRTDPTAYTVELARRAVATYGLDGSPTIHYPATMTSDERIDDLYRRRILDAPTIAVVGQLLAPGDRAPDADELDTETAIDTTTGELRPGTHPATDGYTPDPFARTADNRCPVPGCLADHYPHDPDDHGHANPCGCDWTYTCDGHAARYRADGIEPGADLGGWYIGPDLVRYSVAEPEPDAGCEPCRIGHHANCTATDGDCTGICHPHAPRPVGSVVDDDPDGLGEELAALLADRLEPLTGPGFRPATLRASDSEAARVWRSAQLGARIWRDRAVRRGSWMSGDLAAMASRSGLVPGRVPAAFDDGDDGTGPARGIELAAVWSGLLAQAEAARLYQYTTDNGDGTDAADEPTFDGWRGDRLSAYDASAERFALSPSGRWSQVATLPPIYAAGVGIPYVYRASADRGRDIMAGYTGPADGILGDDDTR